MSNISTTVDALAEPKTLSVEELHTPAFRRRRTVNWLTLGFTYSAMYMGRYNLSFVNLKLSEKYGWDKTSIYPICWADRASRISSQSGTVGTAMTGPPGNA